MRVYLTRHGLTEWNIEKRMHGHKNANLTKEGIEDAKKLGKSLQWNQELFLWKDRKEDPNKQNKRCKQKYKIHRRML